MEYYEFPVNAEELILGNSGVEEMFYIKDLAQRKLYLTCEITDDSVQDPIRHILQFNREDAGKPIEERKPILLYISSDGGSVDAGFSLIDVIKLSKTPVYTINLGWWYSMGLLIGLAGHKRYASPNSKFLMHDGSSCVYNSSAKAQDQMRFQRALDDRMRDYIIENSKLTKEEYDDKMRIEWYMFSDEAKKYGFADYIIGEDCEIYEVI